jgi:hypothetical protein
LGAAEDADLGFHSPRRSTDTKLNRPDSGNGGHTEYAARPSSVSAALVAAAGRAVHVPVRAGRCRQRCARPALSAGWPGGISPPGSHRTERDSLPSFRSSHPIR